MGKYRAAAVLPIEIEQITGLIEEQKMLDNVPEIQRLEKIKEKYLAEFHQLTEEMQQIRRESPRIYSFIYWHDIKGYSWQQVYWKCCPDLIYSDPAGYIKKAVAKYMEKKQCKKNIG